jgi:hypothetical protein
VLGAKKVKIETRVESFEAEVVAKQRRRSQIW